ncbi:hypothetical protein [Nocardia sp. NPDC020380]|uniref:hypothetical protein n=1 Tax=Nocardia sp. NPDC020380 TaxID=3364309 RepID=UPI00378DE09B
MRVVTMAAVAVGLFGGAGGVAEADDGHAEQVATDYAVGAATCDYRDMDGCFARMKAGAAPELAAKYDATRTEVEHVLVPLRWVSTASPISSAVTAHDGSIYHVDVLLDVRTTNSQSSGPTDATVTYKITLDESLGWEITDVGGDALGAS